MFKFRLILILLVLVFATGCEARRMYLVFVKETSSNFDHPNLFKSLSEGRKTSEDEPFGKFLNANCLMFLNEAHGTYRYVCTREKKIFIIGKYKKSSSDYPEFISDLSEREKDLLQFQTKVSEEIEEYLSSKNVKFNSLAEVVRSKDDLKKMN